MTDRRDAGPRVPARVGVIGGGRMGAGIAHAFALAGASVVVIERDADAAAAASARVLESLRRSVERGATTRELAALTAAVETGTDAATLAGCGLVIEAVPEDRALKVDALVRAERVLGADAVLATNTSSISIDDLAGGLDRPDRLLGLHFFNPVPASQLVEIVVGRATRRTSSAPPADGSPRSARCPSSCATARASRRADSVSRSGSRRSACSRRVSLRPQTSTRRWSSATGIRWGPLRTTDLVGLDVRLGIAEELHARLGDRFAPPELLRRMVADGHLGRKTGRGFYEWSEQ